MSCALTSDIKRYTYKTDNKVTMQSLKMLRFSTNYNMPM